MKNLNQSLIKKNKQEGNILPLTTEFTTLSSSKIIEKILDFLSKNSYIDEQAVQLSAYGRFLKNIGDAIENHASDNAIKFLSENEMNMDISDMNVSYREYFDKIQVKDDKILNKYLEKEKELKKELSEIRESIKNRKKKLESDGVIIKILKNKSLSIRNK